LRIVDTDTHMRIGPGIKGIYPYMPENWQKYFKTKREELPSGGGAGDNPLGTSGGRDNAKPPNGGPAGSDPEFMRTDLLDRWGIDVSILNCVESMMVATGQKGSSTDESIVLCSAINDYYLNEWTPVDKRYRYTLIVPTRDPLAAAKEIHRCANNPAVAGIDFAPLDSILMGNRYYYPIYEAAAQHNLPIYQHVASLPDFRSMTDKFVDRHNCVFATVNLHLSSALFSGLFERFPNLKVVFAEFGFAWVAPFLWRADNSWEALPSETPLLKKAPSEYVHGHVWWTSQPVPTSKHPKEVDQMIDMMGDDLIVFSTDYPHWDNDAPSQTFFMRSEESRRRIFAENAAKAFRI